MKKVKLFRLFWVWLVLTGCLFTSKKSSEKLSTGWYLAFEIDDIEDPSQHFGFLDNGYFYLAIYTGEIIENSVVKWLYGNWEEIPGKSEIIIHLLGNGKTEFGTSGIDKWQDNFTLYKSMDTTLRFELIDSLGSFYLKSENDLLKLVSKDFPLPFQMGVHDIIDLNMPENLTCEESLEWFDEKNITDYNNVLNKMSFLGSKENQNRSPWIPPATLQPDGTVAPPDTNTCDEGEQGQVPFPLNCYSTVLIKTNRKYISLITIRDTKSNIVHRSTQWFGFCNELQNSNRMDSDGMVHGRLVWNMKNEQGNYVKDGIYLWEVSIARDGILDTLVTHYVTGIIQSCSNEYCYY